jgi:hypothetical protein
MTELTREQQDRVEELADSCHLVLVDRCPPNSVGAVLLTPCNFCDACGGDGFTIVHHPFFEREETRDCRACNGRGGAPRMGETVRVLQNGTVTAATPWVVND